MRGHGGYAQAGGGGEINRFGQLDRPARVDGYPAGGSPGPAHVLSLVYPHTLADSARMNIITHRLYDPSTVGMRNDGTFIQQIRKNTGSFSNI